MKANKFGHLAIIFLVTHFVLLLTAAGNGEPTPGQGIGGVHAAFTIKNTTVHMGKPLVVELTLINSSDSPVTFSYLGTFILHVRAYDRHRKLVPLRVDAPEPEPIRRDVLLGPHERDRIEAKLNLTSHYNLVPGVYYLRFFYDLRLIENASLIEEYRKRYHSPDYVPWDPKYYRFQIVK